MILFLKTLDMLPRIYFCSKNTKKISEFCKMIPSITPLSADLTGKSIELEEIQSFDPKKVIEHKLNQLLSYKFESNAIYLVEDTSFFAKSLSGFPGPYIKDFFNVLGAHKFSKLCKGDALITTHIGSLYIKPNYKTCTNIFEGYQECTVHDHSKEFKNTIVESDYDCVVSAKGSNVVFYDDQSTKLHRTLAIKSFQDHLNNVILKKC